MKRGMSPLVATVLIVGLAVASIITISIWSREKTEELTEGTGKELEQYHKSFEVNLKILAATPKNGGSTAIDVTIQNDGDALDYTFKGEDLDGNIYDCGDKISIGNFETKTYTIDCGHNVDFLRLMPLTDDGRVLENEIIEIIV